MQFAHPEQALRVAPLLELKHFEELEKNLMIDEEHIAFAEKNEKGELEVFHGLKQFLSLTPPLTGTTRYIFDNHNHALFFRYLEYLKTGKICKVIHIDQHSDLRDNQFSLPADVLQVDRSREVFHFVQNSCTVGNFLQPTLRSGLISEVVQVRTETSFRKGEKGGLYGEGPYILDLDLDFFAPEMGIQLENYLPKLKILLQGAECVTIATSPYFLEQGRAIEMVKEIFTGISN